MDLPDPFDISSLNRPDTEIKIFSSEVELDGGRLSVLKELRSAKRAGAQVLHVAEPMLGNIFPRPYPFVSIRPIAPSNRLPSAELKEGESGDQGDPNKDFFRTIRSIRAEKPGGEKNPSVGHVFLGFKVFDHGRAKQLDTSWQEWSGLGEMLRALDKHYFVRKLHVLKSVNAKPDLLSYCILLELIGSDGGLIARSYLQKFRAQRMSGYVAMYEEWDEGTIDKVLASSESLNAIIFDLTGEV